MGDDTAMVVRYCYKDSSLVRGLDTESWESVKERILHRRNHRLGLDARFQVPVLSPLFDRVAAMMALLC